MCPEVAHGITTAASDTSTFGNFASISNMKLFMCALAVVAAVSAAPSEEGARDKRGIYGESALPHLHHDPLLGTHAHIPAAPLLSAPLHAAPVLHAAPSLSYAPLASSSIRYAPLASSSLLHHAPLSSHAVLSAPAPLSLSHSHIDTPVLHGNHFDTLHSDVLHAHAPAPAPIFHHAPAPIIHHAPAPIIHHAPAPIIHHAPAPIIHHAPAPIIHHAPAPIIHHAPASILHHAHAPIIHHAPTRTIKITKILHAPAQISGW